MEEKVILVLKYYCHQKHVHRRKYLGNILVLSRGCGFVRDHTHIIQTQKAIIRKKHLKWSANYSLFSDAFLTVPALFYLIILFKEVKDLSVRIDTVCKYDKFVFCIAEFWFVLNLWNPATDGLLLNFKELPHFRTRLPFSKSLLSKPWCSFKTLSTCPMRMYKRWIPWSFLYHIFEYLEFI